jgi:lyso-ornithine lipid O-acyltransferase
MFASVRIFATVAIVLIVTLTLLPLHGGALAFKHRWRGFIPVWWHRVVCSLMRLKVTVHGEMAVERPLLLVSNHVSWKDIAVLGSVAPLSFISKGEVRDWPLFGWLARLQRTVFIDRNDRRKAGAQASEIAARLAHERDVMVLFPEGTTGDGTRLLAFKSSLVGAAERAVSGKGGGVIQPVAILYARSGGMPSGFARRLAAAWIGDVELVPHLRAMLTAPPMDAEVMFGPPVRVGPDFDRKAVTRDLEATIGHMLVNRLRGHAHDAATPDVTAAE